MKKLWVWVLFALLALFLTAGAASAADVTLTSVGQSPDAMMVRVVMKGLNLVPDYQPLLKAEDLKDCKVLVAVVGGSSKGLGAAGIDKDDELARAKGLLEKAKAGGSKILVMHVGGEGRRGTLSDLFIESVAPFANSMIIVDGGDNDGIFKRIAEPTNTPILSAPNVKGTAEPLKTVLTEWGVL
ncbi:MAG: hypothetical protein GX256_02895 [Fretibacterium sp.]|nr:hypothetical protein [Fretibacterium sp.]